MKKLLLTSILLLSICMLNGCASIMRSNQDVVTIQSNVEKTDIEVINSKNQVVFSGQAPTTLTLKTSTGSYLGNESYKIKSHKKGYQESVDYLDTTFSGWYFGNIIFGGLIGILIVDPITGAMFTLMDDQVFINLIPEEEDESISDTQENASETPESTPSVCFFRPNKITGMLASADILLEDDLLGKLSNGSFFCKDIGVGRHTFTAKTFAIDDAVISTKLSKNKRKYIEFNFYLNGQRLREVSKEYATPLIESLTPLNHKN